MDWGGIVIRHRGECGDLVPWEIVLSLRFIRMDVSSRMAMHPWLHSRPIERSAPAGNRGNMWALCAPGGKWERYRSHVCDDCMLPPSGISTDIELVAIYLLWCGVVMDI